MAIIKAKCVLSDTYLLNLLVNINDQCEILRDVINFVDWIREKNQLMVDLSYSSRFYEKSLAEDKVLGDYIYKDLVSSEHRDIVLALTILLDKLESFEPNKYLCDEIVYNTEILECGHYALLCYKDKSFFVISNSKEDFYFFDRIIDTKFKLIQVMREWVKNNDFDDEDIYAVRDCLFNNLYYVPTDFSFSRFGVSSLDLKKIFVDHLAFLNDRAQLLYQEDSSNFEFIANAAGINLSPESPQTHRNKSAMKKREISISNNIVICEWHTKITPTKGRIHFHFGINFRENIMHEIKEETKGKLIIGIFCEHLPT